MCVDAKLNFDDNAEFRQKEIFELRDYSQEDPREGKLSLCLSVSLCLVVCVLIWCCTVLYCCLVL
jgi:hypothetical protein